MVCYIIPNIAEYTPGLLLTGRFPQQHQREIDDNKPVTFMIGHLHYFINHCRNAINYCDLKTEVYQMVEKIWVGYTSLRYKMHINTIAR